MLRSFDVFFLWVRHKPDINFNELHYVEQGEHLKRKEEIYKDAS